eukprot:8173060-Pyramimonas_sp.AAC.1
MVGSCSCAWCPEKTRTPLWMRGKEHRGFAHMEFVGAYVRIPTERHAFNRDWHAGKPAEYKSEEESQPDVYEVDDEDAEMAEEVDPAEAALGDGEASDSGITDAT